MGLFNWLGSQINRNAQQSARIQIADERNLTGKQIGMRATAEQHYIRLWISELFLRHDQTWFTSRFPLAYSVVGLDYGGQTAEIANVSGKNKFNIQQPDLGRSILRDYPLTPLLPFRGGTIELDCGLVSMQANNVLEKFAGVVSDIAAKMNQPFASEMVGIAGSIAAGVQGLLGAGNTSTVLYVHQAFQADTLESGYTYLSSKKQAEVKANEIWITPEGVRTGTSEASLRELDPQDYLVIKLEVRDSRDDFLSMKIIEEPLNAAIEADQLGESDKAKLLLAQAKRAALNSNDLTRLDKVRIMKGIDAEFAAPGGLRAASGDGAGLEPTSALKRAAARVSTAAAASDPAFHDSALLRSYAERVQGS